MSKESWVGFPEVQANTGDEITIGYTGLPVGLEPDRLQLNVGVLQKGVIGWGGYSALTLAAYKGEEDQFNISGRPDESGIATANGIASVARAESSTSHIASDQHLNAADIRNGVLGIQWNINALNSRLKLDQQFDPSVRAKQLNRAVQKEAIAGVWKHNTTDLFHDRPISSVVYTAALDAWFISLFSMEVARGDVGDIIISLSTRAMVFGGLLRTLRSTLQSSSLKDMLQDPLFLTARPTRAITGIGVLATQKIVRPTPAKQYR